MTALAPAYAHAFQTACCGARPGIILINGFRLTELQRNIVNFALLGHPHTSNYGDGASSPLEEPTSLWVSQLLCEAPSLAHSLYAGAYIPPNQQQTRTLWRDWSSSEHLATGTSSTTGTRVALFFDSYALVPCTFPVKTFSCKPNLLSL